MNWHWEFAEGNWEPSDAGQPAGNKPAFVVVWLRVVDRPHGNRTAGTEVVVVEESD